MMKAWNLYNELSDEQKLYLGSIYIVNEIETRFAENPELNDRFTQDDKEIIFEQSHEAWLDACDGIGSSEIANVILDAVIDKNLSIEQLKEMSTYEVLDMTVSGYYDENELDEDLKM